MPWATERKGEFTPKRLIDNDWRRVAARAIRLLRTCTPRAPILTKPNQAPRTLPPGGTRVNRYVDYETYEVWTRMDSWSLRYEGKNRDAPPKQATEARLEEWRAVHAAARVEAEGAAIALIADLRECGSSDKYRPDRSLPGSTANDDPYHESDTDSCHSDVTVWDSNKQRYERLLGGGRRRPWSSSRRGAALVSRPREWLVDSGSCFHILGANDLSHHERSRTKDTGHETLLSTANGPTATRSALDVALDEGKSDIKPIVLPDSPPVLSMGQMIRKNGCKFYWDEEQGASLTLRDGRVVHLEVKDDVPVMSWPAFCGKGAPAVPGQNGEAASPKRSNESVTLDPIFQRGEVGLVAVRRGNPPLLHQLLL